MNLFLQFFKNYFIKNNGKSLWKKGSANISGKTSIINALKNEKNASAAPTVGFKKDSLEKFNFNFQFSDMSGQNQYRGMWQYYLTKIDGLIFVIDSSDKIRFGIALDELKLLFEIPEFNKNLPILVYVYVLEVVKKTGVEKKIKSSFLQGITSKFNYYSVKYQVHYSKQFGIC
ncbi:unnamed protein product [Paramecium pentaurelia]|uniref:Uncharacterized protein n=1 Tax=Paramecium pentaurelia TaxID=43138 RepID=A0A8S1SYE3_9CILI|nr:unnamed protein product [Paramecium pentaurelia]